MSHGLFVVGLGIASYALTAWACRVLPREGWQFLATVPCRRGADGGRWAGVNLTFYGLFTASALAYAVALFLLQMAAVGVPRSAVVWLCLTVLGVAIPAARFIARIVERKRHTFTVGGAAFVGLLITPVVTELLNRTAGAQAGWTIPALPAAAALSVAYTMGEGIGRLACISFGCCYGRPLAEAGRWAQRLFGRAHFVFHGPTRKIAYASGLDGVPVVPIQGLTAVVHISAGLAGLLAFLEGAFAGAFAVTLVVTQAWRVYSETLRADYRGGGRVSAYQTMSMLGIVYGLAVLALSPAGNCGTPDLGTGLRALWSPGAVLGLQALWLAMFLYSGISRVTAATVDFHVCRDHI